MKKRLLAALLLMCLALTLLPAYALADNTEIQSPELLEGESGDESNDVRPVGGPFLVSFDPRNGVVTAPTAYTNDEGRLGALPMAFRTGYTFVGWYTIDGMLITKDYVFTRDTVLYARWQLSNGVGAYGGTAYKINNPRVYHGKVNCSCDWAVYGTLITLTVTPDSGYELESLKVKDKMGADIELTKLENRGEYSFNMPPSYVIIRVSFSRVSAVSPPAQITLPFTDVPSDSEYYDSVRYVYENGIMRGTNASRFSPDEEISRAMIVTILHRLEGIPAAGGADFVDTEAGQWYSGAVAWASANDIVYGYGRFFYPNESITYEQFAAILYRYSGFKGYDTTAGRDLSGYVDAGDISEYALKPMQWASAYGIIIGENGRLLPGSKVTRAEAAAILTRFCSSGLF